MGGWKMIYMLSQESRSQHIWTAIHQQFIYSTVCLLVICTVYESVCLLMQQWNIRWPHKHLLVWGNQTFVGRISSRFTVNIHWSLLKQQQSRQTFFSGETLKRWHHSVLATTRLRAESEAGGVPQCAELLYETLNRRKSFLLKTKCSTYP